MIDPKWLNLNFLKRFPWGNYLRSRFELHKDMLDESTIVTELTKGSELVGANLWLLICAIFIASLGLDVNSTAVIIGAMLISPLMGPIMGVSLGVATFRYRLIQLSAKNLGFAVIVSVLTSTTYFLLSPMDSAQSEILARTHPTIWDVLIALFGGLAGMIGASRKQSGNVIPGVAIATALMPPLCTAGFGLAQGEWSYFFGAFYLFFINSVFICLGGVLVLKYLQLKPELPPVEKQAQLLRRVTIGVALLTTLPSFLLTYRLLNEAYMTRSINTFIEAEVVPLEIEIVSRKFFVGPEKNQIHLVYLGPSISLSRVENLQSRLADYGLSKLEIHLKHAMKDNFESSAQVIRAGIIDELIRKTQTQLEERGARIQELESKLKEISQYENIDQFRNELKAQLPDLIEFTIAKSPVHHLEKTETQQEYLLSTITTHRSVSAADQNRLREWLKAKYKVEKAHIQFQILNKAKTK